MSDFVEIQCEKCMTIIRVIPTEWDGIALCPKHKNEKYNHEHEVEEGCWRMKMSKDRRVDLYLNNVLIADNLSVSDIMDLGCVIDCIDDGGL